MIRAFSRADLELLRDRLRDPRISDRAKNEAVVSCFFVGGLTLNGDRRLYEHRERSVRFGSAADAREMPDVIGEFEPAFLISRELCSGSPMTGIREVEVGPDEAAQWRITIDDANTGQKGTGQNPQISTALILATIEYLIASL